MILSMHVLNPTCRPQEKSPPPIAPPGICPTGPSDDGEGKMGRVGRESISLGLRCPDVFQEQHGSGVSGERERDDTFVL